MPIHPIPTPDNNQRLRHTNSPLIITKKILETKSAHPADKSFFREAFKPQGLDVTCRRINIRIRADQILVLFMTADQKKHPEVNIYYYIEDF